MSQQGDQTHTTCRAQQCCDMLRWNVAIVWPGLEHTFPFVPRRVALIFRVRSAQKLALSDGVLLKRLCLLVLLYSSYLTGWTAMQPPFIETAMTADDLKYERCVENWFDLTIIFGKRQN